MSLSEMFDLENTCDICSRSTTPNTIYTAVLEIGVRQTTPITVESKLCGRCHEQHKFRVLGLQKAIIKTIREGHATDSPIRLTKPIAKEILFYKP